MTEREKDVPYEMRPIIRPWLEHAVESLPQGDQLPDRERDRVFEQVRSDVNSPPSASRPVRSGALGAARGAPPSLWPQVHR